MSRTEIIAGDILSERVASRTWGRASDHSQTKPRFACKPHSKEIRHDVKHGFGTFSTQSTLILSLTRL